VRPALLTAGALQSAVALVLLLGTARAWQDVDTANALAYVFVAGIAGLFAALLAVECAMVARERANRYSLSSFSAGSNSTRTSSRRTGTFFST
jgi:hypothetical protein